MALKPGGPPLPGDGSGDRHMPGGRRPLGPANGGVTEDWGKIILRIKEDLTVLKLDSILLYFSLGFSLVVSQHVAVL